MMQRLGGHFGPEKNTQPPATPPRDTLPASVSTTLPPLLYFPIKKSSPPPFCPRTPRPFPRPRFRRKNKNIRNVRQDVQTPISVVGKDTCNLGAKPQEVESS